jgi:hypothetical protein
MLGLPRRKAFFYLLWGLLPPGLLWYWLLLITVLDETIFSGDKVVHSITRSDARFTSLTGGRTEMSRSVSALCEII